MSSVMNSRKAMVAASVMLLAGAVAFAADMPSGRTLAKIKKDRNGQVSLKQVANYNNYKSEEYYHATIKNLTNPADIRQLKMDHGMLNIDEVFDGGILHGQIERGDSVITIDLTGPDGTHTVSFPARFEVHSAPRTPGVEIDTFATNMYQIEGVLSGDSIFSSLRLVGGTGNGYDSPGQMSIIDKGDSVLVDSFFNIGYRIEYTGAEGGPLAGQSDVVEGKVTMRSYPAKRAATAGR